MSFSMSLLLAVLAAGDGGAVPAPTQRATIPPSAFTVFKEDSGPVNYYSVGEDNGSRSSAACTGPGWGTSC